MQSKFLYVTASDIHDLSQIQPSQGWDYEGTRFKVRFKCGCGFACAKDLVETARAVCRKCNRSGKVKVVQRFGDDLGPHQFKCLALEAEYEGDLYLLPKVGMGSSWVATYMKGSRAGTEVSFRVTESSPSFSPGVSPEVAQNIDQFDDMDDDDLRRTQEAYEYREMMDDEDENHLQTDYNDHTASETTTISSTSSGGGRGPSIKDMEMYWSDYQEGRQWMGY